VKVHILFLSSWVTILYYTLRSNLIIRSVIMYMYIVLTLI